jgi:membrane fusion protein (multidrug efflux system)
MASSDTTPVPPQRRLVRRVLLVGGPILLVAVGLFAYLHGGRYVTSDNAYVHADKLAITSEVAGSVVEVAVHDNEPVTVGQILCRLDDSVYRIAVNEARAQLDAARTEVATLRATYRQKQAQIAEAREQAAFAERELNRQQELASGHVATEADLDRARHALEAARSHVTVLQQDAATALAALGGNPDQPDEQFARVAAARAKIEAAERDLGKTVIKAPIAGIVTNVSNVAIGKYLTAGQPAFSLVATDHVWIEANLKETELTYVKPGDPVVVEIDTYPHREWPAKVATIGPATGAEFSVIPAQNAAGNWVKVVQRIPVRIEVEGNNPAEPLRAGMSAEVKIDTGHTRRLGDLTRTARRD